jgi:hypothetical protein
MKKNWPNGWKRTMQINLFDIDRLLAKLPNQNRQVDTAVQQQLIKQPSNLRYTYTLFAPTVNPPQPRMLRPKKRTSCQLVLPIPAQLWRNKMMIWTATLMRTITPDEQRPTL